MADIAKLIAQLKKRYPDTAEDPILDELEIAASGGDEDAEGDEPTEEFPLDATPEDDSQESDPEPEDGFDMPDLEKEADLMSEEDIEANPGVPAKKRKKKSASEDDGADAPEWINGKY